MLPMASLSRLVWVARGGLCRGVALHPPVPRSVTVSCLTLSHPAEPHTRCLTSITSLAPGLT